MKRWHAQAVSAVLALAVLVPNGAFAADAVSDAATKMAQGKGFGQHQVYNQVKQQEYQTQLLEQVSKYTPNSLDQWKAALTEQESLMQQLIANGSPNKERPQFSEEAKAKFETLREDLKNGNITQEQAQEKMKDQGIQFKVKDGSGPQGLSAELKEQMAAIREELKNGKITPQEMQEKMKAMGVEPKLRQGQARPELSAEQKEKRSANPMAQYRAAVEAQDTIKLQELLPQMLAELQERNQAMSNKLAESQN